MTTKAGTIGHAPSVLIRPIEKKPEPEVVPQVAALLRAPMAEREKYLKLWDRDDYRDVAPGEHLAMTFLEQARPEKDAEVIDFGCGTGRGALALALFGGLRVKMLDFAANCLDPEVAEACETQPTRISFREHDLSEMPEESAAYGYCFPAGTIISGASGAIEDYRVGDKVIGTNGHEQEVLQLFERQFTGELVTLQVSCIPDVQMTDEHPVRVAQLARVHRQRNTSGQKSVYEWVVDGEAEWRQAKDVRVGDWVQVPVLSEVRPARLSFTVNERGGCFKEQISREIDQNLAWLLGLWVAEGWASESGRLVFSLGAHERDIADRAVSELVRLGVNARFVQSPSTQAQNGLRVVADCVSLAGLLREICGHGARDKKVPQEIKFASREVIRGFVDGLFDGDGCLRRHNRTKNERRGVSTVSARLAYDLQALLFKMGIACSLPNPTPRLNEIQGRIVDTKPAYEVQWSDRAWDEVQDEAGRAPYGRVKFIADKAYLRVEDITLTPVRDVTVYNVHTTDETYAVPFVVHNCTDVMEHIPTDDVPKVLRNILGSANHVFFGISTVPDRMGAAIGQELHLTVKPMAWWTERLTEAGAVVHWCREIDEACFIYCSAWKDAAALIATGVVNVSEETINAQVSTNIQSGWVQAGPYDRQEREVVLLAGGPSMAGQIDKIRELRAENCALVTVNGAYKWAIDHGLTPSAQVVLDAREFNARFTRPVLETCRYLIASQCHPSTLEGLPRERTFLWHSGLVEANEKLLADLKMPYFPIPGGSTVVLRSLPLLRMLGYTRFHMFGFDSCVQPEAHHAYEQTENDNQATIPVTCGGRTFQCVPWQLSQASEFRDLVQFMGDEMELAVYGDGLIAHMLQTGANFSTLESKD